MASFRGYTITQPFGVKNSAYRLGYHPGTDFRFALGSKQPAFGEGIARYQKDTGGGYGNTGTVTLSNGDVIFHAHLKKDGILVKSGSKVYDGDYVFVTGDTGFIKGVHAHVEYRIKGSQNSPADITKKAGKEAMYKGKTIKQWYDWGKQQQKYFVARKAQAEAQAKEIAAFKKALEKALNDLVNLRSELSIRPTTAELLKQVEDTAKVERRLTAALKSIEVNKELQAVKSEYSISGIIEWFVKFFKKGK